MVTQVPISVRMDFSTLEELDLEASLGEGKRNRLINDAVRMYMDYLDTRRYAKQEDETGERELINRFIERYFKP